MSWLGTSVEEILSPLRRISTKDAERIRPRIELASARLAVAHKVYAAGPHVRMLYGSVTGNDVVFDADATAAPAFLVLRARSSRHLRAVVHVTGIAYAGASSLPGVVPTHAC
jgi:hypothetical protein